VLTQNPGGNVGVFVVDDQLRKRGARARSGPWMLLLPAEHAAGREEGNRPMMTALPYSF
jgi:hypothetical protein